MPAKKADKAAAIAKSSKSKKKKWSKGKTREKLVNAVWWDQATYDKLIKEVPAYKLITPSVVADRLRLSGGLAKQGLRHLEAKGLVRMVSRHSQQMIYTRAIAKDEAEAKPVVAAKADEAADEE